MIDQPVGLADYLCVLAMCFVKIWGWRWRKARKNDVVGKRNVASAAVV